MISVAFCTSVNGSYESQLSIWVKDYCFKMQSLKEYYFSDTCLHHIKLSDRKDLCRIFSLKNKTNVYVVVQYFTEKFWNSYTKSIHNRPSNRYNICVIVWFILIMVIFFCQQRPMYSILQLQLMKLWDLYFQNFYSRFWDRPATLRF